MTKSDVNCKWGVIVFQLRPDFVEKFERKITAIYTFPTFEALFAAFPKEQMNDVYQYYTPEKEKQFGVVAIELGRVQVGA